MRGKSVELSRKRKGPRDDGILNLIGMGYGRVMRGGEARARRGFDIDLERSRRYVHGDL